ncbi:MAG: hypothetical protein H0W88_11730 [Parachlamydiaceae bacterium]|nr:hypothetical protein [Parachlamydiaceae bacterium]
MQISNTVITQPANANVSQQAPILNTSRDVLLEWLSYANAQSLGNICATCHDLRGRVQVEEEKLWARVAKRELRIDNIFGTWSWRDCVIIKKQWQKNIYKEKEPQSGVMYGINISVSESPYEFSNHWNCYKDAYTMDKMGNLVFKYTTAKNLDYNHLSFFDGNRCVHANTIRTQGEEGDEVQIVDNAGNIAYNTIILITDRQGKTLNKFQILKNPKSGYGSIRLFGNYLIFIKQNSFYFHELPIGNEDILFENFTRIMGRPSLFNYPSIQICQNNQTLIFDISSKTVVERIPTQINDLKFQKLINNILVQVTTNELIGYKKEQIQQGDNLVWQWTEIWRVVDPNVNQILSPQDNSHLFMVANNIKLNKFHVYDVNTGELIRELKLPGVRGDIDLGKSIDSHSLTYVDDYNSNGIKFRDYSPLKLIPLKSAPRSSDVQNNPETKTSTNYSLSKKIALFALGILTIVAIARLIIMPKTAQINVATMWRRFWGMAQVSS